MIRIKFRGKRIDNGECVYGAFYPIKNENVYFIINNCKSLNFDDDDTTFNGYKVHKKSVGQFTGLHDKNGKEIYTGDIFQLKRLDGSILLYKIFCVKGGFAFNAYQDDFYKPQSEIYFYESTSDMQSSGFIRTLEIIGNLYENPELLEKKFSD